MTAAVIETGATFVGGKFEGCDEAIQNVFLLLLCLTSRAFYNFAEASYDCPLTQWIKGNVSVRTYSSITQPQKIIGPFDWYRFLSS